MMKNLSLFFLGMIFFSCAGIPTSWESRNDALTIRSGFLGEGVKVHGIKTSDENGTIWEIEKVEYFASWDRGWTEAVFTAEGLLRFSLKNAVWEVTVVETPEILAVEMASVRLQDSFYKGDQALSILRNRWARIHAAVTELPPEQFSEKPRGSFDNSYGPVYFPELYGYGPGGVPIGPYVTGEEMKWDTGWTAKNLPEFLREVRDSGTLFRDWEEGLELWYLAAQWNFFWESADFKNSLSQIIESKE